MYAVWSETPIGGEAGTVSDEAGKLRTQRGQLLDLDGTNRDETGSDEEQEQWNRRETMRKRVVKTWKSRGRGRDANAPAGGPRVPNSDEPIDEEYDNDD